MNDAQLRVSKETLVQTVTALDTSFEQSVEKDIVLPDYCPDVFRILKCRICPCIVSQSIAGGKLSLDTEVTVRVMYLSADSGRINLLEHKASVTKTLDLGCDPVAPIVSASAAPGNVSCRVVSPRRVDIRGMFTVKVRVTAESRTQIVTDAVGAGIQLRRVNVPCPTERLTASKRITIAPELELGGSKPPVGAVLRTDCRPTVSEQRVIQGKLMIKGEAVIDLLYTPADPELNRVETMRFGLPFSQLIDIDGLDESFTVIPELQAAGCDIIPQGENGLECELVMLVNCTAVRYEDIDAVTDAFSTRYECRTVSSPVKLCGIPEPVSEDFSVSCTLTSPDSELEGILFAACDPGSISVNGNTVSGSLTFSAIGTSEGGMPVRFEDDIPFEFTSQRGLGGSVQITVKNCSYHLTDGHSAELRAELTASGFCAGGEGTTPLSELEIDASKPAQRDRGIALRLCYAEEGEDLWELARRCGTSPDAIAAENGLCGGRTEKSGMLLIPMTD